MTQLEAQDFINAGIFFALKYNAKVLTRRKTKEETQVRQRAWRSFSGFPRVFLFVKIEQGNFIAKEDKGGTASKQREF